ncbi:biotin-protein ligase [Mucor mucedo]|uniref:biotin-protein ligase n=1 Tax=Mucor mucedo TaxID=29922 RepID=UPI002220E574|nr:biotin-protein ligase [Mucor mucedo]KAI7890820.1 biotin-protein ligase [Mucor mucedo]
MPGGRDMPYCQALDGAPNTRIRNFVGGGGIYLGICAGAYYGSQHIEFEKGRAFMEIIQSRELGFYPGLSRGTTYPGFIYNSESGAQSVTVVLEGPEDLPREINMYYNGGGYFVEPEKYENVTVLGRYKTPSVLCKEPKGPAAIVQCKVGKGNAILIGTHPEYDISSQDMLLTDDNVSVTLKSIVHDLILSEKDRRSFLASLFARIGLHVRMHEEPVVPHVTPLYLAGLTKEWVQKPVSHLLRISDPITHLLEDKHDIFHMSTIEDPPSEKVKLLNVCRLKEEKPSLVEIIYPRSIDAKEPIYPSLSHTPCFDMKVYFQHLVQKRTLEWGGGAWLRFGNGILYAQVMESTQSLMDKNFKFSQALPSGFITLATNQIAGRGRGRNERSGGYENIPLRLKWPNDIYVETKDGLKKVGGLLINSTFVDDEFVLVIGCGINLSNREPTVSINDVIETHGLSRLSVEDVLAGILVKFEIYYTEFCEKGMGACDAVVTLTTHNNESVKIIGITSDYGMLKVESLDRRGKIYGLLPDGNSFDMMNGLLVQKK